jgi:hypothetical protein
MSQIMLMLVTDYTIYTEPSYFFDRIVELAKNIHDRESFTQNIYNQHILRKTNCDSCAAFILTIILMGITVVPYIIVNSVEDLHKIMYAYIGGAMGGLIIIAFSLRWKLSRI